MTPAEFKCLRESMGLSTKWLAERWGVAEYSVQRWERNRFMPDEFAEDMLMLKGKFDAMVAGQAAKRPGCIIVPRVDVGSRRPYPAAWHRQAAQRVRETTGAMILFADDDTDLEPEPDDLA